jgi:hypothetical protein
VKQLTGQPKSGALPCGGKDADSRITDSLMPCICHLYGDSEEVATKKLRRFRRSNGRHLEFIVANHAEDPRVAPLLHQPELPLILDLLESDPYGLLACWPDNVPRIWLEALAEAWGSPL